MKYKVLSIKASGEVTIEQSECTLEDLQAYAGGYVQAVYGEDWVMWLDEEGKLTGKPVNAVATHLVRDCGLMPGDMIVGDVVVTGGLDREGELRSDVPDAVINEAAGMLT